MTGLPSLWLLDAEDCPLRQADFAPRAHADRPGRQAIVCAACAARITDASQRIEVSGQHEHTFFNPAGIVYRIGCFRAADGCNGVGPFSADFSWFAEHRWQVVVCASCSEHLGWHFRGAQTFAALILDRLRELDT